MSSQRAVRSFVVILAIASPSLLLACAGTRPAASVAASPVAASTAAPPEGHRAVAVPTSGTVSISEEVRRACGIADEDAYFSFDSSTLLSTDISPLDAVARCFTVGPLRGRSLRLVGHADPRGPAEYNMTLGQGRADSVEVYLGRRGVSPAHIATTSRGAIDASGTSEPGWAHDRRVDVVLGS